MRRLVVAIVVTLLGLGFAVGQRPVMASCAGTATMEQIAKERGTAVFTGRATGQRPGSQDLVFAVDRWFAGPHAGRTVDLVGYSARLVEPGAAGLVPVARADTTAGDAITLPRDQAVLMIAQWDSANDAFAVRFCSVAGVPIDTPEGREALRAATAVFGAGLAAAALPATDAPGLVMLEPAVVETGLQDWWPILIAFAVSATLVMPRRRLRRAGARARRT